MYLVPKNLISWIVGALSRIEFPHPFSFWLCQIFVRAFRIDMVEAERELHTYSSIEEVFTRKLTDEARPVVGPVCSPADGFLSLSMAAENDFAIQAKGITYSLSELVLGETAQPPKPHFEMGWFTTVYLAPHNYHRVHSPVSGQLKVIRYLPGELWPVNGPFVKRIPRLFNRNERLVFEIEAEKGGLVFVVMVGALNVGRISTPFWDLKSNALGRQLGSRPQGHVMADSPQVAIGDELGTFMLGSTVVVAYDKKFLDNISVVHVENTRPILMGQSLTGKE